MATQPSGRTRAKRSGSPAHPHGIEDCAQYSDPYVSKLAQFFLSHPAWIAAAKNVADGASSRVYFSHVPGEFHLLRHDGQSLLLPGPTSDPDFAFRFTPPSIDAITSVAGDVGDFAVALFRAIVDRNPEEQIGFRVVAPFRRLLVRGYVGLLLKSGPKVLRYGASHGITTVGDLRRFIAQTRVNDPRWRDL
ncbi:MAG: hypothetical protein U0610_26860 [bacterium]